LGHLVTPSYFPSLGVRPALGRFFDENLGRRSNEVVISYQFPSAV